MNKLLDDSNKILSIENIKICMKYISKNIITNNLNNNIFIYKFLDSKKNIDEIFKYIEYDLVKRILQVNSPLYLEKKNYDIMTQYFKGIHLYNSNIILNDYEKSMNTFESKQSIYLTQIMEYNYIRFINGITLYRKKYFLSQKVSNTCINYHSNDKRKELMFHPHLGMVDINFNTKYKKVRLIMLPIHALLLESFEEVDCINIDIIENYLKTILKF